MAQQGRIKSPKQLRTRPARPQQGGFGSSGRGQQQQKDMGVHPAYGKQARDPDGKDEDYGNRGLRRQAGTTKVESPEDRSDMERTGIAKGQDVHERDAIGRRDASNRSGKSSREEKE
jgi:hypothetical protein